MPVYSTTTGEFITEEEAAAMTALYRTKNPSKVRAYFLGKDKLQQLMDQEDVVGLRIYNGINSEGKQQVVVVGAKSNGNDVLTLILDRSLECPSACSTPNVLNCGLED